MRAHTMLGGAAAALLLLALGAGFARAQEAAGVPLPRGSRAADPASPDLLFVSGRGFRDTVEHVRKHVRKRGIDVDEIPVYRRKNVTVARFVARAPTAGWRAIHVFHTGNRTYLAVVPTSPPRP